MGYEHARDFPQAGKRDPRFPPMVRFNLFVEAVERLSEAGVGDREEVLAALSDNDRSQLVRALALFRLRTEEGDYDEVGIRRLANPTRRAAALRELLRRHFSNELAAIRSGIARDELEEMLAVPGRSSRSSREKARQFLERAMEVADMATDSIAAADRAWDTSRQEDGKQGSGTRDEQRARYITQQQDYLDQLIARHSRAADDEEAQMLRDAIQTVSRRLDRLIAHVH